MYFNHEVDTLLFSDSRTPGLVMCRFCIVGGLADMGEPRLRCCFLRGERFCDCDFSAWDQHKAFLEYLGQPELVLVLRHTREDQMTTAARLRHGMRSSGDGNVVASDVQDGNSCNHEPRIRYSD